MSIKKDAPYANRSQLIKSYGFVEQITTNESFLKESLELAAKITESESAYISLLDDEQQYILCQNNSELSTMDVENSICQFTIKGDEVLEIENIKIDDRTKYLPIAKEEDLHFYAGFPLKNIENYKIGALCVIDRKIKNLTTTQKDILELIGKQIINTLDQQRALITLIKQINNDFNLSSNTNIKNLQEELTHLQKEVLKQNETVTNQNQDLEKLNTELNSFVHVVAHDVKSPLRTIRSFAQLLERELVANSSVYTKEYFNFINQGVMNLDELITDLLEFATMDKNNEDLQFISLSKIIDIASFNLMNLIKSKDATIEKPKKDFMVKGHKSQLITLFQNLISNGIKYQESGSKPSIKIEAIPNNKNIFISITDNGIGIPKEYFQEILKPFKRLHNSNEYKGSGIGLATCQKILQQIDSELTISSKVGKGSTFTFQLVGDNEFD